MNTYHKNLLGVNILFCVVSFVGFLFYMYLEKNFEFKEHKPPFTKQIEMYQNPKHEKVLEILINRYNHLVSLRKNTLSDMQDIIVIFSLVFLGNIILIILGRQRQVAMTDKPTPSGIGGIGGKL